MAAPAIAFAMARAIAASAGEALLLDMRSLIVPGASDEALLSDSAAHLRSWMLESGLCGRRRTGGMVRGD